MGFKFNAEQLPALLVLAAAVGCFIVVVWLMKKSR